MHTTYRLKQILALVILCFFALSALQAKPYGEYDVKQIVKKNGAGQPHIDLAYVDAILGDLRSKALGYPVQFDNESDLARARNDLVLLVNMLSVVGKEPDSPFDINLRLGILGQIGYNLQLPAMNEATQFYFTKALKQQPQHGQTLYHYGLFFANSNRPRQAIDLLESAKSVGHTSALFTLGLTYLSLQEPAKALENLLAYQAKVPSDASTVQIIEAIKQGNVNIDNKAKP